MNRNKKILLGVVALSMSIASGCGQIDPVELLSKFEGRQAETAVRGATKIMGIRYGDHRVKVTNNVMVAMRDGLRLATDVYMPLPEGKYPAVTCRLPYEKKKWSAIGYVIASNGYVFVIQDTRSSGESEGTNFLPVISDYSDGHDLIAWIKDQDWYNGKIGAWGASFLGRTQWMVSDSPDMTCLYPQYTSTDFAAAHRGGAMMHEAVVTWVSRTGHHAGRMEGVDRKEVERLVREEIMAGGYYNDPIDKSALVRPGDLAGKDLDGILEVLSEKFGEELSWTGPSYSEGMLTRLRDMLVTPGIPEATMGFADPLDRYRNMKSPALLISGWYDVHNAATMRDYENIVKYAPAAVAENSRVIVGPWAHVMPGRHDAPKGGGNGGRSFSAYRSLFIFEWWDYWLKDIDSGFMKKPRIKIYVMGINEWRYENEWPLARTKWTEYYLRSGGKANSIHGDGTVSTEPPGDEPPDRFDFDPRDPAPTRGGCKLLSPSGSLPQNDVEERMDVLVYDSEVLKNDLEITGPLKAVIFAASSAKDTDFTAKLVDVYPDGTATLINNGIIRARFRDGRSHPSLIEPGKIHRYEIDLWCTSNVFKKGHRIRVEVSSSDFPRYDRNANRGGEPGDPVVAHQTIYHDAEHPSHLVLPVIP
jgi:predicted acyl esterase